MTAFFIKTDCSIAGPFTGVELREAALAGILSAESAIAGSPEGPWIAASHAGLFSPDRVALPHPVDVSVPRYQVRGMPGAIRGPFKLRELIGFASRGMLPMDAVLQSGPSQPWIPVHRLRILTACLQGELTLIDRQGNVIRRAAHPTVRTLDVTAARAPIELARTAEQSDTTAFAPAFCDEDVTGLATKPSPSAQDHLETGHDRQWASFVPRFLKMARRLSPPEDVDFRRIGYRALPAVGVLILLSTVVSAFSYWKQLPMPREQVIGDWMGHYSDDEGSQQAFAIAFRENGSCVIFNPHGPSWSGDFVWNERHDGGTGFKTDQPFTVMIDTAEPRHALASVRPSDGYVRFAGRGDQTPVIDGHGFTDAFVRRESEKLHLGYLVRVEYGADHKSMQAAWITLRKMAPRNQDRRRLELAAATIHGKSSAELLSTYGIPDEARQIHPFEVAEARRGNHAVDAQVIRYADTKWIQSADGTLQAWPSSRNR